MAMRLRRSPVLAKASVSHRLRNRLALVFKRALAALFVRLCFACEIMLVLCLLFFDMSAASLCTFCRLVAVTWVKCVRAAGVVVVIGGVYIW